MLLRSYEISERSEFALHLCGKGKPQRHWRRPRLRACVIHDYGFKLTIIGNGSEVSAGMGEAERRDTTMRAGRGRGAREGRSLASRLGKILDVENSGPNITPSEEEERSYVRALAHLVAADLREEKSRPTEHRL